MRTFDMRQVALPTSQVPSTLRSSPVVLQLTVVGCVLIGCSKLSCIDGRFTWDNVLQDNEALAKA
jgi:hypothetical protein